MSRGLQVALVCAILLLAVAVAGLGAFLFLGKGGAASAEQTAAKAEAAKETAAAAAFFKTSHFVTDLADRDRLRYADVTVALGMKDDKAVETAKQMEPELRDLILGQLRQLTAAELSGAKGKEQLAESLKAALGGPLKDGLVKVYVTDLTVQ